MGKPRQVRDSTVTRGQIRDRVRVAVWAKAAGRCVICNESLFNSRRTHLHTVFVGQLAHNVGAKASKGSPRGKTAQIEDREAEENLLLLCPACHRIIDDEDHAEYFDMDRLHTLKDEHEERVRRVTEHGGLTRTGALRLMGSIRKSETLVSRREVAQALLTEGYLGVVDGRFEGDFSIRVNGHEKRGSFWVAAKEEIDESLNLASEAHKHGALEHLSVFAIAPVPVLVYLGSALDDKLPTVVYQKSRDADLGWNWPSNAATTAFGADFSAASATAEDVVLVLSLTAEVQLGKGPTEFSGAPRVIVRPQRGSQGPDCVSSRESLKQFTSTWRSALAEAESRYPNAKRWHLVAAAPVSACVEAGRAFMRSAHPTVAVYQRSDQDTYEKVLEVNA